jgi:hypothetical protein
MKLKQLSLAVLLCSGFLLCACGCAPAITPATPLARPVASSPTATSTPLPIPTFTPTLSLTSTFTPVPTLGSISMNCQDGAVIESGAYRAENNTWGKSNLTGWTQCIGIEVDSEEVLSGQWTWDWLEFGGGVKAYPEVIFGQKPGTRSTTIDLPKRIADIEAIIVTYDVASTNTGTGNVAFDIWLTDTQNPDTFGAPPITHEIMIWLDTTEGMQPGGDYIGQAIIDDTPYHFLVGDNWGDGWRYIAFKRVEMQLGSGSLDLASFFAYLKSEGLVSGEEYVASVEFGNEVVNGAGETILRRYEVVVR